MNDDGLTQPELSAYLRRLAALELTEGARPFTEPIFCRGRASALLAVAELVERGEIRAGLLSEPIYRLHLPSPPDLTRLMPDD